MHHVFAALNVNIERNLQAPIGTFETMLKLEGDHQP